jgi:hypothetical protein
MSNSTCNAELLKKYEQLEAAVVLLLESPRDTRDEYFKLLSHSLVQLNQEKYRLSAYTNSDNQEDNY